MGGSANKFKPLLVCAGMGVRLQTYYRKRSPTDAGHQALLQGGSANTGVIIGKPIALRTATRVPTLLDWREDWCCTSIASQCLNILQPAALPSAGKERWRVGAVVPLQPTDDSPFLGNLKTAAPQLAVEVGSATHERSF